MWDQSCIFSEHPDGIDEELSGNFITLNIGVSPQKAKCQQIPVP